MFWRMAGLSTVSPVESILDKELFTLEELMDEDEIIQECKSLNNRLINFLRGKNQVQELLRYVVDEPLEGADNRRAFKFPFIACEILTCEIDVIFKIVVEDEELMGLLFSFLDNERPHGTLLAGYFSKVVICLMVRKTVAVMNYLKAHQDILQKLVDLIGITSIMEVLIRLVGGDDHIYTFHAESLQWLADTELLELLVDKLSPQNSSADVHANVAEALSAVTRLPHSALASKLSSPSFVGKLFHHALEDSQSKSTLIHSLSVCISLLDPKRATTMFTVSASRGQQFSEPLRATNPETIDEMLQRLGDLLSLLDTSIGENVPLPTTYGELRPPLGIHRLKIVEFLSVILRSNSEGAKRELVNHGAIKMVVNLFFQYPFNNALHHHVGNMIGYCIESNNEVLIDHIFHECDLVGRILAVDEDPFVSTTQSQNTISAPCKNPSRIGNNGHLTRIANKIAQARNNNSQIQDYLQSHPKWDAWQANVLNNRNTLEDVYQWTCGRPTALQDRPVDHSDDEFQERDFDVSTLASNLTREVFQYGIFDNEDADEGRGAVDRDEEDMFYDDESAEVVMSTLRLGEPHESGQLKDTMFNNSNWFPFQEDRTKQSRVSSSTEEGQFGHHNTSSPNSSSSDDEVVVGEDDELLDTATSRGYAPLFRNSQEQNGAKPLLATTTLEESESKSVEALSHEMGKVGISEGLSFLSDDWGNDLYSSKQADWVGWRTSLDMEGTSGRHVFSRSNPFEVDMEETADGHFFSEAVSVLDMDVIANSVELSAITPNRSRSEVPNPLFVDTLDYISDAKAMDHTLEDKVVVGEADGAAPLPKVIQKCSNESIVNNDAEVDPSFGDVIYWKSGYDHLVGKEQHID